MKKILIVLGLLIGSLSMAAPAHASSGDITKAENLLVQVGMTKHRIETVTGATGTVVAQATSRTRYVFHDQGTHVDPSGNLVVVGYWEQQTIPQWTKVVEYRAHNGGVVTLEYTKTDPAAPYRLHMKGFDTKTVLDASTLLHPEYVGLF